MDILIIAFIVVIVMAFLSLPYFYVVMGRNMNRDLAFASQVLNAPIKKGLARSVKGAYGEREMAVDYYSGPGSSRLILATKPHHLPADWKQPLVSYPKPTERTIFTGEAVSYELPSDFVLKGICRSGTDKEMRDIFDELARAAEIVETGALYYKK